MYGLLSHRSRPVIQLQTNLSFSSSSKMIGLNDNCELKNNVPASCVKLDFCMKYGGVGVPNIISKCDFDEKHLFKGPEYISSMRNEIIDFFGSCRIRFIHEKTVLRPKFILSPVPVFIGEPLFL